MQLNDDLALKIENVITELGFVIFHLNFFCQGKTKMFRILVDKSCGGITIGECAQANLKLNELLEKEFGPEGDFSLEVSSPGIDWPMKGKKDFERVIFKKIHLFLKIGVYAKSELTGILKQVRDDSLILDLGEESVEVRFVDINKAKEEL